MSFRSLALGAAALFALSLAQPVAAQTLTSLPYKDSNSTVQNQAVYSDGTRIFPGHMEFGWTGSAAKAWTIDSSGYGGVNVFSSVLPAGAATQTTLAAMLTALGTPLQAGGQIGNGAFGAKLQDATGAAFGTAGNPIYISGGGGGGSTPTGPAGTPTASVVSVQGISGATPIKTDASATTQPISASALPLPTGAGTAANQASILAAENSNVFFAAQTTPLAAGATLPSVTRDVGVAAGSGVAVSYFNAMFYSDQAGTAYIDVSDDGTNWTPAVTATALAASTPLTLTAPLLARYYRPRLVNGATAQTVLRVSSAFSRN